MSLVFLNLNPKIQNVLAKKNITFSPEEQQAIQSLIDEAVAPIDEIIKRKQRAFVFKGIRRLFLQRNI